MLVPMVIAAVMLGKSFDLDSMLPGKKIFNEDAVKINKMILETPFTRSEYKLVQSSSDVSDFLNVDGELSLKVKSGKFQIKGSGNYLKSTIDRSKTVELLISVYTEQFVETFPSYTSQVEGWDSGDPGSIGTHYVRGMVYGAQLIISYKLEAESSEYREEISGAVQAHLGNSGSLNADVKGKLEKIHKELSGKCEYRIRTYATCPPEIFVQPMDLDGVFNLTDSFPSLIRNLSQPIPVRIELEPLSSLSSKVPNFQRNIIDEIINDAINKYDDLRMAKSNRESWERPDNMTDELIQRLEDFDKNLSASYEAMRAAIESLNSSAPFEPSHFDAAFALYAWGGYNFPNRFTRDFDKIKNDAKNYIPLWYPYTRAVNEYTHWGQITCSMPSPEPILFGMAASSPKGFGNGADLQCVLKDPVLDAKSLAADARKSAISGLTVQLPNKDTAQLVCARCLLENATSIVTVPAKTRCPEGAKLLYDGFMATGFDAVTEPICVDKNPLEGPVDSTSNVIKPMWMVCPNCEHPHSYVPCVVCSR